jgi:hypothetical protein
MLSAEHGEDYRPVPALDAARPVDVRTATFSLG